MATDTIIQEYKLDTKTFSAQVDEMGGKFEKVEGAAKKSAKGASDAFKEVAEIGKKVNTAFALESVLKGASSMAALKKVLKDATDAAIGMKEGTAEYQRFVTIAAQAKEEITQMKQRITTLRPEEKAQAFRALGQSVVGAFQAGAGALAVFTGDNKELNDLLLKSMAIINALEGVQALVDAKKQARNIAIILGLKGEAAAKAENVVVDGEVVAANEAVAVSEEAVKTASPWGWILLGITALIGIVAALYNRFKIVGEVVDGLAYPFKKLLQFIGLMESDKIKDLEKSFKDLKASSENYQGVQEQAIRRATLEGKSLEEINRLTKELIMNKYALLATEHNLLAAKISSGDASEADIKRQHEITALLLSLKNDVIEADKKVTDEKKKEADKQAEDQKKADEKAKEAAKKLEQDKLTASKSIRDLRIGLMAEGMDKEIATARAKTEDLINGLVGTPAQIKEQTALLQKELEKDLKAIVENIKIQPIELKVADPKSDLQAKLEKKGKEDGDSLAAYTKARNEQSVKDTKDAEERKQAIQGATFQLASDSVNLIGEIRRGAIEKEQQDIDQSFKTDKENLDRQLKNKEISQADHDQKLEELNAATLKKTNELRHKSDVQEREQSLFKIAIETAIAIMKGFAEGGPVLAAIAGATGVIQAAAVLAHPLPKYAKGTKYVQGPDGIDKVPAWLTKGERVVPVKENMEYSTFLDAMMNGTLEKEIIKTYNIPAILERKNQTAADSMMQSMLVNSQQFDTVNLEKAISRNKVIRLDKDTIKALGQSNSNNHFRYIR
jgi:hypothetical protein